MAKTFQSLKSTRLGELDFFQFGKYQNCRVDSIVQMDYNYIMFLHNNNKNMFEPAVVEKCLALKAAGETEQHYQEEILPFEDVPF